MQEQMDPSQLSDDYGDAGRSELSKQMASLYTTGFAYSRIGDLNTHRPMVFVTEDCH